MNTVEVTRAATFGGNAVALVYRGVVDDAGTQMEGDLNVAGFGTGGFVGTTQ